MPTYGGYQTVHEFSRSGIGSVATARASGADGSPNAAAPFAIKALQPPVAIWGDEKAQSEVERFLERARAQQQVAAAGEHWAPIHALGEAFGGAYYATDHYTSSVQRLIAGQVKLDGPALYVLVRAVVRGLR